VRIKKDRKGKERKSIADTPLTKRSDMDHTDLPANYTIGK